MPARLPVTGPAELFFSTAGFGGPYLFLGTDEGDPHIQINPTVTPVFNDYGGSEPFDWMYQGESAIIAMNLSRWDTTNYFFLANRPTHAVALPGANAFGEIGDLYVQNGNAFSVIVTFPYFLAASNAGAGMPPGYRFFACELIGPDDMKVGTRNEIIQVVFKAMRVFLPRDGTVVGGSVPIPGTLATPGGFALYDNTIPALPLPG